MDTMVRSLLAFCHADLEQGRFHSIFQLKTLKTRQHYFNISAQPCSGNLIKFLSYVVERRVFVSISTTGWFIEESVAHVFASFVSRGSSLREPLPETVTF